MPPIDGTSCDDSSSLSVRLSCDRCRFQKLKCFSPAGSAACQRCTRARVSCVFGRRTPSKRTNRRLDQEPTDLPSPPTQPVVAPVSPATSLSTSGSGEPGIATCSTPVDSEAVPLAAPELERESYDAETTWNGPNLSLQSFAPNMSQCDSDMAGYDYLQSGLGLDDVSAFETGQSGLIPWSQLATLTSPASWPTDGMAAGSDTGKCVKSSKAVLTGERLTALVSDIQQQLRKLEEGPWHTNDASSLDDYPVGTILELSQHFSALAGSILSSTVCVGVGLEEVGDDDEKNDNTSSSSADTPTMLLVMCGYIWLVRICSVVMGHFQKHLNHMPTSHHIRTTGGAFSPVGGITSTAAVNPALRLSELPCVDAALGLQQIHTAMSMVLGTLNDIEGYLGREAVVARNMAVALLLNSGRHHEGSSYGLNKKAMAVKELLREKLGL